MTNSDLRLLAPLIQSAVSPRGIIWGGKVSNIMSKVHNIYIWQISLSFTLTNFTFDNVNDKEILHLTNFLWRGCKMRQFESYFHRNLGFSPLMKILYTECQGSFLYYYSREKFSNVPLDCLLDLITVTDRISNHRLYKMCGSVPLSRAMMREKFRWLG